MWPSVVLAKILAALFLAAGLAALINKRIFSDIIEDLEKSPALCFMIGFYDIIIGVLLIEYHNIWIKDWPVLITIIGWIKLIKGSLFIAFPKFISYFKKWYRSSRLCGVFLIALGLAFTYFGFAS